MGDCSKPSPTKPASFQSSAEVVQRMGGVWRRCDGGYAQGEFGGRAGFEVEADGHVYALDTDASGELVRTTGFAHETWLAYVAQQQGIDYYYADGGFNFLTVYLSDDGATMQLDGYETPSTATYVATHETVIVPATAAAGAREGAAGCNVAETGMITPAPSVSAVQPQLLGKWLACPGGTAFGTSRADVVGVEFDEDATWAFLVSQNGTTVKSTQPDDHGTFELLDDGGSVTGASNIQLDMNMGSGTYIMAWAISTQPMKLSLDNEGYTSVLSGE